VEVGLLNDDDGALGEALAVQGADVARPASEPEGKKNNCSSEKRRDWS